MKNSKIISIMLLFALCFAFLVSCDSSLKTASPAITDTTSTQSTSGESELPPESTDPFGEKLDFGGEEITIWFTGEELEDRDRVVRSVFVDEADPVVMESFVNRAIAEREKRVERELNVKIEAERYTTYGLSAMLEYNSLVNDMAVDIVFAEGRIDVTDMAVCQSMVDLYTIPEKDMYIDLDADYWDKEYLDIGTHNGTAVWLTGDLVMPHYTNMDVAFVNAKLWDEFADKIKELTGTSDPYELVKSNKWTMDLFYALDDIIYKDLGNEGLDRDDRVFIAANYNEFGHDNSDNSFAESMAVGFGYRLFSPSENGYVIDYMNDRNIAAIKGTQKIYSELNGYYFKPTEKRHMSSQFAKGNTFIYIDSLYLAEDKLDSVDFSYYILPLPKLNNDQSDYLTSYQKTINHIGILNNAENVAACTAALELLARYSEDIKKGYYESAVNAGLKSKASPELTAKGVDILNTVESGIVHDYGKFWVKHFYNYDLYENLRKRIDIKNFTDTMQGLNRSLEEDYKQFLVIIDDMWPDGSGPHVHTVVIDPAVAPTCSNYGSTEGSHCSFCDEILVNQHSVNPIDCIYDENDICTMCGKTREPEVLVYTLINNGTEYELDHIENPYSEILVIPETYNGLPVTQIGILAFDGAKRIKRIELPSSITSIEENAFRGCESLESINIPNSVTKIGDSAFRNCQSLKSIVLPDRLESIADRLFTFCSSLESISIGRDVGSIEYLPFDECNSLKTVEYRGTVEEWNAIEKSSQWKFISQSHWLYSVICTDGTVNY